MTYALAKWIEKNYSGGQYKLIVKKAMEWVEDQIQNGNMGVKEMQMRENLKKIDGLL